MYEPDQFPSHYPLITVCLSFASESLESSLQIHFMSISSSVRWLTVSDPITKCNPIDFSDGNNSSNRCLKAFEMR